MRHGPDQDIVTLFSVSNFCYKDQAVLHVVNDAHFFPRLIDFGERTETKPVVSETTSQSDFTIRMY